jgi:hypothetical protein
MKLVSIKGDLKSMYKSIIVLLIASYSSSVLACGVPVTPLRAGEQAPCAGYLFSPEKELQLRIQNEEYKVLMEQVKLYLQQKELYKQELAQTQVIIDKTEAKAELWKTRAVDITEKYVTQQENHGYRDWAFLLAGVGITALAGWTVGQVSK